MDFTPESVQVKKIFKQILQRWHVKYKFFVIGGWSKISLRNGNGTGTLILMMKILLSAFINCYLSVAIIILILSTYTTLACSLSDSMSEDSPNFEMLKPFSGTRSNASEVPNTDI